jgi:hypothetical protein
MVSFTALDRPQILASERLASEIGQNLAGRPLLAPRSLAYGHQDVFVYVERGARASDASASLTRCWSVALGGRFA